MEERYALFSHTAMRMRLTDTFEVHVRDVGWISPLDLKVGHTLDDFWGTVTRIGTLDELKQLETDEPKDAGPKFRSLEDAQAYLQEHAFQPQGTTCPCCQRKYVARKRKLNANMAYALVRLYARTVKIDREWAYTASDDIDRYRELPKLRHWGLIVSKHNVDPDKKDSGQWKLTQTGIDFVHRLVEMPTHILLLDNQVAGCSDGSHPLLPEAFSSIDDALTDRFSYAELMKG